MAEIQFERRGRPLWVVVLIALVLTGPVATSVGAELGIGSTALGIWGVAKWPAIVLVVMLLVSLAGAGLGLWLG